MAEASTLEATVLAMSMFDLLILLNYNLLYVALLKSAARKRCVSWQQMEVALAEEANGRAFSLQEDRKRV